MDEVQMLHDFNCDVLFAKHNILVQEVHVVTFVMVSF